jgi:hypothetical protein
MLGIILLIFGVTALGAYLAKVGRSSRLGLVAMVIMIVASSRGLMITGWSSFAALANGRAYPAGMQDAMRIDVAADFIVIFMISIALGFISNVLLGITILRSRTLPKWAGVIWLAWAAMFYVAGILYGFLFAGSSPPTQPIGSLLMAINGWGIVWTTFRQLPPIPQRE